jgi:hypothetical protein
MRVNVAVRVLMGVGLAFAPALAVADDGRDNGEGLTRLRALGGALRAEAVWSAAYSQEYTPAGMSLGEVVTGRVWAAWPDRALFATGDPVVRWMGMAGLDIRLLDLENQACDDHRLTPGEWERIPLVAVLEPLRAEERFLVEADGDRGIALTPREAGGVDRVTVEVGGDGLPERVVVRDPQGAISAFSFTGWEPVDTPPRGDWLPTPPAGIDCVGGD